jgi:hypothetical protein
MKQINIILDHVYKRNKISNNQHITNLKPYFLTILNKNKLDNIDQVKPIIKLHKKNVKDVLEETCVYNFKESNTEKLKQVKPLENIKVAPKLIPNTSKCYKLHNHCKDTLYWNIYILNYGYLEYINIHHRYGNVMLDDKINMSNFIKNNVPLMKLCNYKMSKTHIYEIASSLVCEMNTTIDVLYAYVVYFKCNITVLHHSDKYFISFTNENNSKTHVIKYTEKGRYIIIDEDCKNIDAFTNNKIQFVYYNKPLNGMSSYKMDQLRNYAQIMGIDINKKKEDLYTSIYATLLW